MFFGPVPDGPLNCNPSVRSESGESPKAPTEIISKERHHGPISIQVLIMIQLALAVKDTVRIGSLQTSKNWESLEADMVKNESWIKGALTRLPFFYGSSWRLAYMGISICSL